MLGLSKSLILLFSIGHVKYVLLSEMKLTKEEMELAKIDYGFRDFCAHLLVKSNRKHLLIQHGPMNHPFVCSVIEALSDLITGHFGSAIFESEGQQIISAAR